MPDDTWPRTQLIMLETERLNLESKHCTDPERMSAIRAELEVLYASMLDIRREQIMDSMPKPKVKSQHWWSRLFSHEGAGDAE